MKQGNPTLDVIDKIERALLKGSLRLPVLPSIAFKVNETVDNPDSSIEDLVNLIQSDIALTAHMLQVANSALFTGVSKTNTLSQAINRLGMNSARNLAISFCLKALFKHKDQATNTLLKSQWQTSTYIAAISSVLAKKVCVFNPERAMLAGLMQDVGALALIEEMSYHPQIMASPESITLTLQRYTRRASVNILKKWGFDAELIDVAKSREQWQYQHTGLVNLSDIIMVSRLHSYVGTPRMKKLPRINAIPAFANIPIIELTPQLSLAILEQSKEEIIQLQKTLL